MNTAAEKKEAQLQAKRDKAKAREEHADKVRLRKKLHIPTQEELDAMEEVLKMQPHPPAVVQSDDEQPSNSQSSLTEPHSSQSETKEDGC